MATVTIEVNAGGQVMTRTRTVTGPHLARLVAAQRRIHMHPPEMTDTQVMEAWADSVLAEARRLTRAVEQSAASQAVTDIDFTA